MIIILPGEPRPLLEGLDHFDDVSGVPGAGALRHPSATASPSRLGALAGRGGRDPPSRVRGRLPTARQEYGDALYERRAGTNAYFRGRTLGADAGAGADARLVPPGRRRRRRRSARSFGHAGSG